jgi:hypothetical protein
MSAPRNVSLANSIRVEALEELWAQAQAARRRTFRVMPRASTRAPVDAAEARRRHDRRPSRTKTNEVKMEKKEWRKEMSQEASATPSPVLVSCGDTRSCVCHVRTAAGEDDQREGACTK